MKMINKKKLWQTICTVLGILCVSILFLLAMIFPKYYCRFYDNNTLNKVTFTDSKVNTYEASYDSFPEKIHAIARARFGNNTLRAVPMNELGIEMNGSELTSIANRELKKLYQNHVLEKKITLKKKRLTLSERYTIYAQNNLKGISCWKLVYETAKRKITLYLDEEFHKIYFLEVHYKEPSAKDSSVSNNSDVISYDTYKYKRVSKYFFTWWSAILHYYNLDSYSDTPVSFEPSRENFYGTVLFEYQYEIELFEHISYDKYGNESFSMGIPITEMIQF